MTNRYGDRLVDDTYRLDEVCEVRLQPDPRDEVATAMTECISERLLARLRHLGHAYELTLLARLPTYGEVAYYPEIQLGLLEDELAFLFEVVSDQALLRAVDPIVGLIHHAHRNPRGWWLVVEPP